MPKAKPKAKAKTAESEKPEEKQALASTPPKKAKETLPGLPSSIVEVSVLPGGATDVVQVVMSDGRVATSEPGKPLRVAVATGFSVRVTPVAQR